MNKISYVLAFVCLFFPIFYIAQSAIASSSLSNVIKKTLPNGMKVIIKESHRAPVVAVQVWVQTGSIYEDTNEAGITHLIEHMIFKGTENRGPGELAKTIESLGGKINAYTSYDYTVYHCVVPRDHLSTALDVLSDAIFHSKFDPQELEREKKVVLEEMKMRLDNPQTVLFENLMKISYERSPYKNPIIGNEQTVASFTRDDILAYMSKHYKPCNMFLVIVGDVSEKDALKDSEKYFGHNGKNSSCDKKSLPQEPEQNHPKAITKKMDCNEGYIAISFSGIPNFSSKDIPALDLLASYLSDGESSYLVSRLKNKLQLVHRISASAFTPKGPGLFEISAETDPDKVETAIQKILAELFKLKHIEISAKDLQRAKVQVSTDFIYSQETMEGEARQIGVFQALAGDPSKIDDYLRAINSLTSEDLKHICQKYLDKQHINVSVVLPDTSPIVITPEKLTALIARAESEASVNLNSIQGKTQIKKFTLSNGLTILFQESHDLPTVAIKIIFPGGLRYETPENNGIFNMLARAWNKGTQFRTAEAISVAIDSIGASINGFSGKNTFGLSGRFTSNSFNKGLKLFTEILLQPSFPDEEIDKLKPLIIAQIKKQEDYMPSVAVREFKKLLFTPHPYSMDILGTQQNVLSFDSQAVKSIYDEYATPDRAVMSIVGDINPASLKKQLESLLSSWQKKADSFLPSPPAPESFNKPKVASIHRKKQQEHIVLGFPGVGLLSKDRFAIEVLNAILSGQGGRLFTELRDKESLAYAVTSFADFGLDYGLIATYIACSPEKKMSAQKGLWREIYKMQQQPPNKDELERAKNWLIGRYQIGLQTPGAKAMNIGLNELYGLGFNFYEKYPEKIRAVTAEDVQRVARHYLDDNRYVLVVVGP